MEWSNEQLSSSFGSWLPSARNNESHPFGAFWLHAIGSFDAMRDDKQKQKYI